MEYEYKEEITATRVGCVGSSDAKMLAQISNLNYVPRSAYKRLAVVNGLREQDNVSTKEMAFGDFIENQIYEHLKSTDERYESNPMWVSEKYSKPNVKCIDHPDIVLKDVDNKVLYVYEVKATKSSFKETRVEYAAQLYHHNLMAQEQAIQFGKSWRVRVMLVHYCTNGIDLNDEWNFDPDKVEIQHCKFSGGTYNLNNAMEIVSKFLATFNAYYEDEEIDADMLPMDVQDKLAGITKTLREIQEREKIVDDFKEKLYTFLSEKGIKSISNDYFSITRVDPTESVSFDYKSYLDELSEKKPCLARRIKRKYEKRTQRKGYAKINLKNK